MVRSERDRNPIMSMITSLNFIFNVKGIYVKILHRGNILPQLICLDHHDFIHMWRVDYSDAAII